MKVQINVTYVLSVHLDQAALCSEMFGRTAEYLMTTHYFIFCVWNNDHCYLSINNYLHIAIRVLLHLHSYKIHQMFEFYVIIYSLNHHYSKMVLVFNSTLYTPAGFMDRTRPTIGIFILCRNGCNFPLYWWTMNISYFHPTLPVSLLEYNHTFIHWTLFSRDIFIFHISIPSLPWWYRKTLMVELDRYFVVYAQSMLQLTKTPI